MLEFSIFPSHDFIGEFTTSYRELSRGQNQFNVYEVKQLCRFLSSLIFARLSQTPVWFPAKGP